MNSIGMDSARMERVERTYNIKLNILPVQAPFPPSPLASTIIPCHL